MTRTDPSETPIDIIEPDEESARVPASQGKKPGFLPIETNWFDRLFISVVIWVALSLLWLRFLEPQGLSLNFVHVTAVLLGIFIVWKG